MHPYHHAVSSARKFGGQPEDYQAIHDWFDESKMFYADFRHRALRHHAEGIYMAERIFGTTLTNSDGKAIPVRYIGEQHVKEDLGRIPSWQDWASRIEPERWMRPKPHDVDDEVYVMATGRAPLSKVEPPIEEGTAKKNKIPQYVFPFHDSVKAKNTPATTTK
jgi:hypothetical protein